MARIEFTGLHETRQKGMFAPKKRVSELQAWLLAAKVLIPEIPLHNPDWELVDQVVSLRWIKVVWRKRDPDIGLVTVFLIIDRSASPLGS